VPRLATPQPREPAEEAPPPRRLNPATANPGVDRAVLLGAARNAVRLKNWEAALSRFEEYFRRFGRDEIDVRKEYAGVLVQAGRLPQAVEEYQDLQKRFPEDAEVRTALADLAVRVKDYRRAIGLLGQAIQRDPGNVEMATRLARAHVFQDDFPRAVQVFDQYLARLRPGDERVPDAFPALLVDLERPADALTFLGPLLAKRPASLELQTTLVRAHAKLGDRARALEALGQIKNAGPEAQKALLELGDTLYSSEDLEVAAATFDRVIQADPGNGAALVGLARVHIRQYQPAQARALLEGFTPAPAVRRRYLQARAEFHELVGEFADAKQVYERFLREDENDHEIRLSLGALYEEPLREDERAKAEYAKIPPTAAQYRLARVGIAATLTNQRLFPDAVEVCRALLAEYPGDGNAAAQWARTLGKAGRYTEAVAVCRAFLEANARNVPAVRTVRLALGTVLLEARRRQEAVHEFEQVLAMPGGKTPATLYGLAQAAEGEGNADKSRQILGGLSNPLQEDPRHWILLADLYSADAVDQTALEMANIALHASPDNLAALVRAVTAQARLARNSGRADETVALATRVLAVSPNNVRARLEMARALSSAQRFAESIRAYEALIAIDQTARLPRRERARMLQSNSQFAAAQAAYAELLTPPPGEQLQAGLADLAQRDPRVRTTVSVHLPPDLSSQVLQTELSRAGETDPDAAAALNRVFLDYKARCAEQAEDRLEAQVKDSDWRPRAMIPVAKDLLHLEPTNTSVLFDLTQGYGNLRLTQPAIDTFAASLAVDPHEREAGIGLERASLELAPQGIFGFDMFHQFGRHFLAAITRLRYGTTVVVPCGEEDEYVSAGFSRVDYIPRNDSPLQGNILSGGFQVKPSDCCYVFGLANLEDYPDRFSPRVTFDTGVRYDFCDEIHGRAGMYLNNVVENGQSMQQDIYRYGARAGADFFLSRCWSAFATYSYGHYSDRNDYNELFLRSDYILWFPPGELKAIFSADLLNYRASTVFLPDESGELVPVVHPYFSPRLFVYYEGRISWKKWLSRDYFTYANQCWYCLEYAIGWDNSMNNYNTFRIQFNADLKPWLSVGADVHAVLSPTYNAQGATAYLVLRWPWCGR
jgi:tetratricopeptide (TPR) repeat protein